MKFFDEAFITVQSGDGGRGCVSFRREKFIPRGGPDGGDGGTGGNVIFVSSSHRRTLYPFRFKRQFKAQSGTHGQGKQKTGKKGDDLIIEIPPGTLIFDEETNEIIKDFTQPEETYIIAEGGRGGQGNSRFKTATRRAPRFAQPGEPGQFLKLKLELKLLADVGIIGLPNAGKSTLISVISSATPKIADYPFTTLTPTLGVVQAGWGEPFVVADIPGLIEGAHKGVGLGTRFLRHIERTRVLVHLIDISTIDPQNPLAAYETINRELANYSSKLTEKPQIVVQAGWGEPFVVADIPGLIEGAHKGVGLGTRFLRHIERTRVLVHLIDISTIDPQNPLAAYETINRELANYSSKLTEKPQIVVLNKMDLSGTKETARAFQAAVKDREVFQISAATRKGVDKLTSMMIKSLDNFNQDQRDDNEP